MFIVMCAKRSLIWSRKIKMRKDNPFYNLDREYENLINEVRVEKGFTLPKLAEKIGVTPSTMWQISQGYVGPISKKTGELKPWAKNIEIVLDTDLSCLFPREICDISSNNGLLDCQVLDMTNGDTVENPECYYHQNNFRGVVKDALRHLSPKQEFVIKNRFFNELTYSEIANMLKLTLERVRQIEKKAIRELRDIRFTRKLKHFIDLEI